MDFQHFLFAKGKMILYVVPFALAVLSLVLSAEVYQEESVEQHNKYRRRYAAPPLSMSEELNEAAVKCCDYYADIGSLNHKCPYKKVANFSDTAGENLYLYTVGGNITHSRIGGGAGWTWWKEHKNYNHSNVKFSHFTLQIWKSTTHMGIGVCRKNGTNTWYASALYYPHGNVYGAEKSNLNPRDESVTE